MPKKVILENNLKKMRFEHDEITQEELAKQLGVSRQTIIAIEKGKFNPSVALALQMARYFDCQVEALFTIKEEKK
jgi:putative transcriptional regulator